MSKKIKPVNQDIEQDLALNERANDADERIATSSEPFGITSKSLNEQVRQNIVQLEQASAENLQLNAENSQLKDKLAEYISENSDLKKKLAESEQHAQTINSLSAQNAMLQRMVSTYEKNGNNPQTDSTVTQLQNDIDEYLIRISELTLENAKLKSENKRLNEDIERNIVKLSDARTTIQNNFDRARFQRRTPNVYRDGYTSWN